MSVPPPLGLGRPSRNSIRYRLVIVQQPIRARSCGFGEKDKRPIDPPVILRLCTETNDQKLENVRELDTISLFVVQCELYSEDGQSRCDQVFVPSAPSSSASSSRLENVLTFDEPRPVRNLIGGLATNAYQLKDLERELGVFFIFQDLSIRTEGRFRLKFLFLDLSAGEPLTMSTSVLDQVMSEPFSVYTAKNFPGMTESTELSRCFAKQGIKISIRKDKVQQRIGDGLYGVNRANPTRRASP
ncbi:velvet factor [Fennellomyces sp. T-0311]|nr:velvet factor [Fennellomyces sp. T-0311]